MLAGFPDGLAGEGVQAGPATLVGLELAKSRGDSAPPYPGSSNGENDDPKDGQLTLDTSREG